ncbi:MAG: ABC transporter ATP-binding protein [Candidatus Hermodarchaeota archaeon]
MKTHQPYEDFRKVSRSVIKVNNLVKDYGKSRVLNNLSLEINKGSSVGIIGPNGAGKTTLLKCLLGFTNTRQGEIHLFENLTNKDGIVNHRCLAACRKRIGYVPDEAVFYEHLSPREYLEMLAVLIGLPTSLQELRVKALIKIFQLERWADRLIAILSEGNCQRLSIAAAFVQDSELLILDEPLKSLDPAGRYYFQRLLTEYTQKGVPSLAIDTPGTILISSHLLSDIERICSAVIILNHVGQIVAQGSLDEVRNQLTEDASLEDVYLSVVEGWEEEDMIEDWEESI